MNTTPRHTWATAAAALTAALTCGGNAHAAFFDMPVGGTSWIEVSSNACDLGTPALGGDCFGDSSFLPNREYALEPGGSIVAGGEVRPGRVDLQNTGGSGGFAWGSTGGLFTVNGAGVAPVPVMATLHVVGQIDKTNPLTFGGASWKIGNWAFDSVSSDLNFRVAPGVSDGFSSSFNVSGGGFNRTLQLQLSAIPGQAFNLGYQLTTSTLSATTAGTVTVSAQALFGLDAGPGFFVTGSNGYDSRVAAVPEPGTWAMLLSGLGLIGWRRLARPGTTA
jgi:hypothetical protein